MFCLFNASNGFDLICKTMSDNLQLPTANPCEVLWSLCRSFSWFFDPACVNYHWFTSIIFLWYWTQYGNRLCLVHVLLLFVRPRQCPGVSGLTYAAASSLPHVVVFLCGCLLWFYSDSHVAWSTPCAASSHAMLSAHEEQILNASGIKHYYYP